MSLDITLYNTKTITCKCGEVHKLETEPVYDANITHNLTEMSDAAGIYDILWNGYDYASAKDITDTLEKGIHRMKEQPLYFKKFDSANGWGTYKDFLPWLEKLLVACKEYPNATIHISK